MVEITEEDIKEHLNNIVNAIYALLPTRNYVLQLLKLLPRDYVKMVDAYPELFKDKEVRDRLKDVFGIKIGENVERGGGLSHSLYDISERILSDLFTYGWEEEQKKLSEYLGRDLEDLPDAKDELWEQRIQMALSEPTYGKNCEKILRTMVETGEGRQFSINISTLMKETGLDRVTLLRIKNFLTTEIGILIDKEEVFIFNSNLSDRDVLLKKYFGE
jgi:hypothetical protein